MSLRTTLISIWLGSLLFSTPAQAVTVKKVTNLRVESKSSTSVTLKWKKRTQADRYQIRIMNKNGDLIDKQFTNKRTITITGLQSNKRYRFKVRAQGTAHDKSTFGDYSKVLKTKTKVEVIEDSIDQDNSGNSGTDTSETGTDSGNNDNNADQGTDQGADTGDSTSEDPITPTPVLIGFWGLNGYTSSEGLADVQNRYHTTVFQVAQSGINYTVNTFLPLVKAAGMKVTLRIVGSSDYTTSGSFDLSKYQARAAQWANTGIEAYVTDGTLVGIMVLDDIDTFSGTDPTGDDLEAAAQSVKDAIPGVMTYVRQKCSRMPVPTDGTYESVDNCTNQYTNYPGYSDGPVADYIIEQTAAASTLGLGMINGLNIVDGGDGSSGQIGSVSGHYAMTADEIRTYGEALLAVPDIQLFLMWEYDGNSTVWLNDTYTYGADYFNQTDLTAALAYLGELAAE